MNKVKNVKSANTSSLLFKQNLEIKSKESKLFDFFLNKFLLLITFLGEFIVGKRFETENKLK